MKASLIATSATFAAIAVPLIAQAGTPAFLGAAIDRMLRLLERFPLALLQLVFRFSVASVFWHSGQSKIASWQSTIRPFQNEYRVPIPSPDRAATLAAAFEPGCSILIALVFATRFVTFPLLGVVFVIQTFVYPENWVEHLTWAAMLVILLTRGPGAISIDRLLWPWLIGERRGR